MGSIRLFTPLVQFGSISPSPRALLYPFASACEAALHLQVAAVETMFGTQRKKPPAFAGGFQGEGDSFFPYFC